MKRAFARTLSRFPIAHVQAAAYTNVYMLKRHGNGLKFYLALRTRTPTDGQTECAFFFYDLRSYTYVLLCSSF